MELCSRSLSSDRLYSYFTWVIAKQKVECKRLQKILRLVRRLGTAGPTCYVSAKSTRPPKAMGREEERREVGHIEHPLCVRPCVRVCPSTQNHQS